MGVEATAWCRKKQQVNAIAANGNLKRALQIMLSALFV